MNITTTKSLFEKYSKLYSFEEGSPEYLVDKIDFEAAVIEFTKFHVEAALKAASETKLDGCYDNTGLDEDRYGNDKSAILAAYPMSNIN